MTEESLSTEIEHEIDRTTALAPPDETSIRAAATLEDGAVSMTLSGDGNVKVISGWVDTDPGITISCDIDPDDGDRGGSFRISLPLELADELATVLEDHLEAD
jgi:hypothetical protein